MFGKFTMMRGSMASLQVERVLSSNTRSDLQLLDLDLVMLGLAALEAGAHGGEDLIPNAFLIDPAVPAADPNSLVAGPTKSKEDSETP